MLALRVGERLPPRGDAVEEVAHVVDDGLDLARPLGPFEIVKVVEREGFPWQRAVGQLIDGDARE